jgi:DNA invertase Pin-like site-specific DNA recombinase
MKQYAYIRVSSKDQNVDRQFAALEPFDLSPKQIYCDRQSGKDFERPAYQKLIRRLRKGDLLIVKSIDRLGRNYNEILEQWALITKKIGADILVLDMALLDTRERGGDLTGAFIADLVLQILAYVAQTEREFIRQRQAEGIAAAKAKGVRFGRKPDALPPRFEEICQLYASGQLSVRKAAKELGMSKSSFYRKCRRFLDASAAESGEKSDEREDTPLYRQEHEAKQNENLSKIIIPTGRL